MGANAATSVPGYVSGEVLTAARLNVTNSGAPVFADSSARDAAFGGTGEKTLAEGQLCYLEDSNVVQYYDGSSWATVGPTISGATFIAENTFSGAATSSFNNIFTNTYRNYLIAFDIVADSGNAGFRMRLRASAADNTTSNYYTGQNYVRLSAAGSGVVQPAATSSFGLIDAATTERMTGSVMIFAPEIATRTYYNSHVLQEEDVAGNVFYALMGCGAFSATTQFDGFTIYASTGNITGSIQVYGMRLT